MNFFVLQRPLLTFSTLFVLSLLGVHGFTLLPSNHVKGNSFQLLDYPRTRHHRFTVFSLNGSAKAAEDEPWASRALLISSFTDGVVESSDAREFLQKSLLLSLVSERQRQAESAVETSVLQSPCCGPDMDALNKLEAADEASISIYKNPVDLDDAMRQLEGELTLRFVYIPTAMYALRPDSNNTPGKQRQRARADGKKRRNQVVQEIESLLPNVNVLAVTLDLDDGSIKQPDGSNEASAFPKNGKEALQSWHPHFIYVEGGNTFWLHHCVDKGGWGSDIVSACTAPNNAVYCGKSAGAILAGKTVETATWKGWDDPSIVEGMEEYEDWKSVPGLGMVGKLSFFPHMSDEWEDLVKDKTKAMVDSAVVCLREEEASCVDGQLRQHDLVRGTALSKSLA